MKNKSVAVLGIIIVLLAAALLAKKTLFAPKDILSYNDLFTFFPDNATTADVAEITLFDGAKPDAPITLKRDGETWRLVSMQNAKADIGQVAGLLGCIAKMKGEARADDASLHPDFAVDDASAVHIILKDKDGKELANILAGKGDWKSSFVRPNNADVVYAVEDNVRGRAGYVGNALDPTKWLDKVALRLPEEMIDTITVTTPEGTATFTKKTEATTAKQEGEAENPESVSWQAQGGSWLSDSQQAVKELIGGLLAVRIVDIVPAKDATSLDFSTAPYSITTTGKVSHTITALPVGMNAKDQSTESKVYLKIDDDPLVYVMPTSEFTTLFLQPQNENQTEAPVPNAPMTMPNIIPMMPQQGQ
ncbi:DUF4340 domain-containing protein [Desulfovibrio inopinatus]|uniref:DUF4340 domain-containing protein n=1 Tax=Desulfovibrio inopinatus TaxID=102109 RepID=UPI000425FBE7|nr:DUF4340 domain-containing protein [Desulfovibrio inopinatus]